MYGILFMLNPISQYLFLPYPLQSYMWCIWRRLCIYLFICLYILPYISKMSERERVSNIKRCNHWEGEERGCSFHPVTISDLFAWHQININHLMSYKMHTNCSYKDVVMIYLVMKSRNVMCLLSLLWTFCLTANNLYFYTP